MSRIVSVASVVVGAMVAVSFAPTVAPVLGQQQKGEGKCEQPLPQECQQERIAVAGKASFFGEGRARSQAEKAWMRAVLTKYGERYQVWANSQCKFTECVPGGVPGTKRCTYSAHPCVASLAPESAPQEGPAEVIAIEKLTAEEIVLELQERLGLEPDGNWGSKSRDALARWQRQNGVRVNPQPTRDNLRRMREYEEAGGSGRPPRKGR